MSTVDRTLFASIDPRVYATVRITYALSSLGILLELWPLRLALFVPGGTVPRPDHLAWYLPLRWVSSEGGITALFVALFGLATCLLLGLFTRASAGVLYVWSLAYSLVAYPAESGYDALGRVAGLLLTIAPTSRTWSLDRRLLGPAPRPPARYAVALLRAQLVVMYVATVWLKAPDAFWRRGDATAYFLMSIFARHPSAAWASMGRTAAMLTWGTILFEVGIPILLLSRYRRLGLLGGLLLHGGIALASTIGLFSLSLAPYFAAFLEGEDFEAIQRGLRRLRTTGASRKGA